jgi:EF-P beta-lysylation protein EpmB
MVTTTDHEASLKTSRPVSRPQIEAESPVRWQTLLKTAIRDPRTLCQYLQLPSSWISDAEQAARLFPLFAPLPYVDRIERGNPADPLLRQILPLQEEFDSPPGFVTDPVGDEEARLAPGLLHKYQGRALMIVTGACAIHCRYCFRRHYPYSEQPHSLDQWAPALQAIEEDESLEEIILSGGDPLTLVDSQLAELATRLADIKHLKRIRIHTRLPIMIPERVNDALLEWLTGTRLTPVFVIHCNHPAEIDDSVAASLGRLSDAGIPLLNQAVLLRGINDHETTLVNLMQQLVNLRVIPYYLHQLDPVRGAHHFEVPVARGLALMEHLKSHLPGYAVPRYVQERAGEAGKTELLNSCSPSNQSQDDA